MKLLNVFLLSLLVTFCINAQVNTSNLGNGSYHYESELPEENLHFYIFDDGYHSFEHSPTHQFPSYANPASVKLFHAEPYSDDDEPIESSVNIVSNGIANPVVDNYTFDNMVSIENSWNLVDGQKDFFILKFENTQSESPINGCIEFHYDDLKLQIKANQILDDYGNDWVTYESFESSDYPEYSKKFVWYFDNLARGEQRFVYLPALCLAPSMTNVATRAVLKLENECGSTIPWNSKKDGSKQNVTNSKIYTLMSFVQNNPHDPNCIIANPKCLPDTGNDIVTIDYKIYFQNEGEDPAINVYLDFLVDAPIHNAHLVAASHNCIMQLSPLTGVNNPNHLIEFDFSHIYLRGLKEENRPLYEETVGWVEFQVCYDMAAFSALNLSCAESLVNIIFDNEAPVTAYNSICRESFCRSNVASYFNETSEFSCYDPYEPVQTYYIDTTNEQYFGKVDLNVNSALMELGGFEISPNPSNDFVNVTGTFDELSEIRVLNTDGKLMSKYVPYGKVNRIDVSALSNGMYFISIITNGETNTKPFVKY